MTPNWCRLLPIESHTAMEGPGVIGDQPPPDDQTSTETVEPPRGQPRRIGNYRILQLIGRGGMGEVYKAEQEKPVRRKVALKLIKPGMV